TNAEQAMALSAQGQKLFDKLADLRMPTVAILKGACLGGGLELALACDYRLVLDQPPLEVGLPAASLALLPGWGGPQRRPRLVGLENALQMIVAGRRLKAREALEWGLVDVLSTSEPDLATQLNEVLRRAAVEGKRQRRRLPLASWRQRLMESTGLGR